MFQVLSLFAMDVKNNSHPSPLQQPLQTEKKYTQFPLLSALFST